MSTLRTCSARSLSTGSREMDVNAIRADIAAKLKAAGYSSWSFVPGSVSQFPAAVVGVPTAVEYATTLGLALVHIPVTVAFSAADDKGSQAGLDKAAGTSDALSVFVILDRSTASSWRQIHVAGMNGARYVQDGSNQVLAADFAVEVYAQK